MLIDTAPNPTRRITGEGKFQEIPALLAEFQPAAILLVLGEKSFRQSSFYEQLQVWMESRSVILAEPISQNPSQNHLQSEINRFCSMKYDLVLAIGGGSVLDAAKLYALFPRQMDPSLDHFLANSSAELVPPVPLIAVPTTSGTGSEVTPYSSLETPEKKKITAGHPFLYPTVAVIDPELTYSMPAYVTASTGFDALSQAIESFWAKSATPASRVHALKAIELIEKYFETAWRESHHREARNAMAMASCEAGLAIAKTKTTAVHSVSYPITAHFGVAHGHACALTLAEFVRFNAPVLGDEGKNMTTAFHSLGYEEMAKKIETLMEKLELEKSLTKLHIDASGREIILRDGFRPDRILNNPRTVTASDLDKILRAIQ